MMRRRALLGGSNPFVNGYIRDGLTFYIDGIDKSFDDGVLTSLVGDKSKQFTLNSGTLGYSDNSYLLDGNAFVGPPGMTLHGSSNVTIEMCFNIISISSATMFYMDGRNNTYQGVLWGTYSSFLIMQTSPTPRVTIDWNLVSGVKKFGTLTHSNPGYYPVLYINGNKIGSTARDYWNTSSGTFVKIGSFTGHLFSFRVYNRVLTAEEVKSNADNDYIRFLQNL